MDGTFFINRRFSASCVIVRIQDVYKRQALDSMQVTVGISPEGVLWPDDARNAHLIVMLGVPTAMVRPWGTVSYTHLDVYKRQMPPCALRTPPRAEAPSSAP